LFQNPVGFEPSSWKKRPNERNVTLTAEKPFLHRNSLRYRLERIEEITGSDFKKSDERAYIYFSYLLKKIMTNEVVAKFEAVQKPGIVKFAVKCPIAVQLAQFILVFF
jgi:hypothetical protein